jgi:competence protein ComFC
MKIIPKIIDFVVPRFCIACKCKLVSHEQFICASCLSQIKELSTSEINNEFKRKFISTIFIDAYTSLFIFEEKGVLQDLIHALKYNQKFKVGIFLGKLVGDKKKEVLTKWNIDLIIPIPLFNLKKIERGYNQADYIGKGLKKSLRIKLDTAIAKRIKNTVSQTKLSSIERSENMRDAFVIRKFNRIMGKNILIVDDVITTGITVLELARKLKEKGANKVYSLSVATPLISHSIGSGNT